MEYAALFGVVLPLSSRLGLPFLLGGTSNWFRAEARRQAGGWDAHTTDPDRLRREKVAKALRRNSALRGRIERSRREAETLGGGRILTWTPEEERVRRVPLKLARCHAAYPSLEIVLLVEEDDIETRAALDFWPFQVLVVPDGRPRTKPRAVNFGLLHTRGEIVVVFDAEDRPAPDQPRRAELRD